MKRVAWAVGRFVLFVDDPTGGKTQAAFAAMAATLAGHL